MKIKSLSLRELMRYGICGITFISAAMFAPKESFANFTSLRTNDGLGLFILAAFTTGAAFYSFLRALIYPFLGRTAMFIIFDRKPELKISHFCPCSLPEAEFESDRKRWCRDEHRERLAEWADQVHLLYGAGFSLWVGSMLGVLFFSGARWQDWLCWDFWNFDPKIGVPALSCVASAFCADVRRRRFEKRLEPCEKTNPRRSNLSPPKRMLSQRVFLWSLFCMLGAATRTHAQDITSGLVADFKFDGSKSDSSSNQFVLTETGVIAYATDRFGAAGKALAATNDDISLRGVGPNFANQSMSVAFWVKKANNGIGVGVFGLNADGAPGAAGKVLTVLLDYGGTVRFTFWYDDFDITTPMAQGIWYHLACTFDIATRVRKIYLNGSLVATNQAAYPFTGGNGLNISPRYITLDDFRFYNRALSAQDVAALAAFPTAVSAPVITTQPLDQVVTASGNFTFAVAASGTPPLSYQWRKDGVNLLGGTSATLIGANVQPGSIGDYSVVVSNVAGSVTSSTAVLTVLPTSMVLIPSGSFVMGGVLETTIDALPTHTVNISSFYLAKTETTKAEWDLVQRWALGNGYAALISSGGGAGSAHPVQNVSWTDVVKWLNAKSEMEGLMPVYYTNDSQTTVYRAGDINVTTAQVKWSANGYRLPTEAEWEKAARGGLTGKKYPWGDTITSQQANFSVSGTVPVGNYAPNGYGLYDMAGNVWEWCWDWYGATYYGVSNNLTDPRGPAPASWRIFRGGSWGDGAPILECAYRNSAGSGVRHPAIGFRIARNISATDGNALATAPAIITQPSSVVVVAGKTASFTISGTGSPLSYQWRKGTTMIAGATSASFSINSVVPGDAGSYDVIVSNSAGAVISIGAALTVAVPSAISTQPSSVTVFAGQMATFAITGTGSPTPTYQWQKNGANIPGATSTTYTIVSPNAADAGTYIVVVTNSSGAVSSTAAVLTVLESSRLANVSVRTTLASAQTLIVGFVVSGGSKDVLVRAAGPALVQLGIATAMADPRLELYKDSTKVIENDNWPGILTNTFESLGAFSFPANSRDAALLQNVSGSYSAVASGTGPGVVLVETYDAGGGTGGRLINVSGRNRVGTGTDILIAGFYIAGSGTKRLLIRAVGPTIGGVPFNVPGVLLDPKLELYDANAVKIAENDNWDASLAATFASVGAFALAPGSKDAALVVTLSAGSSYTAQVKGADGGIGEALVEVYELP